jgi:hypothetical protein
MNCSGPQVPAAPYSFRSWTLLPTGLDSPHLLRAQSNKELPTLRSRHSEPVYQRRAVCELLEATSAPLVAASSTGGIG